MRVVLRADAGREQGSGHVMRCLTLAEELIRRGHGVHLVGSLGDVGWLGDAVAASGVVHHDTTAHVIDETALLALQPDWVVVDSYRFPALAVSRLNGRVPVLAIVDGDIRGIEATAYLDTNLGAIQQNDRMLAGARYALVRRAILDSRRSEPWRIPGTPALVAFMGGTDPAGLIVDVATALAAVTAPVAVTVVAPPELHARVREAHPGPLDLRATSPDLPAVLAGADIVVAAAGTSAWDVATLGIPAVLVAVVDNQAPSLVAIERAGLAVTIDAIEDPAAVAGLTTAVEALLASEAERERLSRTATALFDGLGPSRVVDALEARVSGVNGTPA